MTLLTPARRHYVVHKVALQLVVVNNNNERSQQTYSKAGAAPVVVPDGVGCWSSRERAVEEGGGTAPEDEVGTAGGWGDTRVTSFRSWSWVGFWLLPVTLSVSMSRRSSSPSTDFSGATIDERLVFRESVSAAVELRSMCMLELSLSLADSRPPPVMPDRGISSVETWRCEGSAVTESDRC